MYLFEGWKYPDPSKLAFDTSYITYNSTDRKLYIYPIYQLNPFAITVVVQVTGANGGTKTKCMTVSIINDPPTYNGPSEIYVNVRDPSTPE